MKKIMKEKCLVEISCLLGNCKRNKRSNRFVCVLCSDRYFFCYVKAVYEIDCKESTHPRENPHKAIINPLFP